MKSLLIVGNGGHGKVVLECARMAGIENVAFLTNHISPDVLGAPCYYEKNIEK